MKKFFIGLSCLALALMFTLGFAFSSGTTMAAAENVSQITVSGTGEIKLPPNVANVSIGVETLDENLMNAQNENAQTIKNLTAILKEMGVDEKDIKTKNFYVYQRYDYSKGETFLGYQVSNYLDFRTKDIDGVGAIISKLLENGANRLSGVTFSIDDYDSAYKKALEKAVENAKSKAEAITGQSVVSSEVIEENSYTVSAREYYSYASNSDSASLMKGEICVKATVKVIFKY